MQKEFIRTEMLLGAAAMERLAAARVAVFGVGGVGGYVVEALARSGIGALDLIDHDTVSESNLNRQIIATRSVIGEYKVDVAARRIADINPAARVRCFRTFFLPDTEAQFDFSQYDYVVDAVDTVTAKLALVMKARAAGTPIISAMGTGNKLDPSALQVADISETSVCPLARIMRKELRKRGVDHLKVVFSTELPISPSQPTEADATGDHRDLPAGRRATPGSTAFVPAAAGLLIASAIVSDLTGRRPSRGI
ncbi:MAG: tRNA threonylcarbamoyladenosine dehydratase [Oscillospiraceae bacterium]|nr:tRNA threonylcarbamoyladenosine dehydratase [Oscillospiraceae bacterium]